MAGRSSELLQRDCISPLTQAHRQADMALVAATIDKKKTISCFMFYLHQGADRSLPTHWATVFLAWLVINPPFGYHQAIGVIQSAGQRASEWDTYSFGSTKRHGKAKNIFCATKPLDYQWRLHDLGRAVSSPNF